MAIAIRTLATATNDGTSATISVTSNSTPQAGDLVVIFHGNDFYALTNMPAPTGTNVGTITQETGATADGGANLAHIKTWWTTVTANGAITITVTETGSHDEEKSLYVFVLSGADTTTPIDGSAGTSGTSATSQPAPSVSPATSNAFLICVDHSGGGSATASYTDPTGMTAQTELHVGGLSAAAATLQLAASGATGTKTFTAASSIPWGAVSVAIKTASAGTTSAPAYSISQYGSFH